MELEIATHLAPASAERVAGDFIVLEQESGRTTIVVGDAVGHGPDAAELASEVEASFHAYGSRCKSPCDLLEAVNRKHFTAQGDRFTTAVAAMFRPDAGCFEWAFAGHLSPHWLDTGLPLDGARPGLPLGVRRAVDCTSETYEDLRPGVGMLMFTDGLEDVRGPGGARFGTIRITHKLAQMKGATPQEIIEGMKFEACEFGGGTLPDDLSMVAVRAR